MIRNIIFDFDGVILDSMPIREYGFREIFKKYDIALVNLLIEYHTLNGGLSRFVKIRYFYEELLKEIINDSQIKLLANQFSEIMRIELVKSKYLIVQTVEFIQKNQNKFNFHIASGSEHNELNFLCEKLGLNEFFLTINGSPLHKNKIVENIILENNYNKDETILIGDSINDYKASVMNGIIYYGFNNLELMPYGNYITSFKELSLNE
jgi:HAD superfamily hydrolase (TIGR01549 family)